MRFLRRLEFCPTRHGVHPIWGSTGQQYTEATQSFRIAEGGHETAKVVGCSCERADQRLVALRPSAMSTECEAGCSRTCRRRSIRSPVYESRRVP